MEDRIIESSRSKLLLCLAGSLVFAVGCLALIMGEDSSTAWRLWPGVIFFGCCALIFLSFLIWPQRLVLDSTGFALEGGFAKSTRKVAWSDIDEFFVWRLPKGGRSVGYRYRSDAENIPKTARLSRAFGADGALPRLWRLRPEELAAELNAYRERAIRQAQNS